ncbi:MAG: metal-dependent transcriptional regulator [Chloroflexi bacterium]|nr:metal-dependent transcriptional regulator [Chloroflexota bacterium]
MPRARTPSPRQSALRREPRHPDHRLSAVTENYLLSLYILKEEGARTTAARIADYLTRLPESERLGTSMASVAGMVRRMVREGLVRVTSEKEVALTEHGARLAEEMMRRHRLAERMVVDLLGVDLHCAHVEAHRLEHGISNELLALVEARLGNPTTCPFGGPIPGSGHSQHPGGTITLEQASPNARYIVRRVPEESQELLRFLVEHQVVPENEVVVREAAPYRGVLTIEVGGQPVAIGYEVASRIRVSPVEAT